MTSLDNLVLIEFDLGYTCRVIQLASVHQVRNTERDITIRTRIHRINTNAQVYCPFLSWPPGIAYIYT